ncbi:MAG: XrtA-associated ATPase [Gammaproteobacteria bacterium]|nr:XrtA-associated ATPase [Gammaproteobacteria bacterium]
MYDKFYNLKAKPFRLSPDPRFLFRSKAHSKALAYLRYGLHTGEGFVVITGGVGTGKTTLARFLLSKINKSKVIAVELVTSQLESDDLLRLVAAALGLAHQGLPKSTLLKNVETFLMARAREGKRVLLLVDEVQNLSRSAMEELRMLSNFQVGEKALLQTFLLGQDEFRPMLQSAGMEQFRQRIIASFHLGPLNREEVQEYILHRLGLCGWQDDPRFHDAAFERIYQYTAGVPRLINKLCDRVLLHGCIEELHEISAQDVNAVIDDEMQEAHAPVNAPDLPLPTDEETDSRKVHGGNAQQLRMDNTISNDERRLLAMEKKLDLLENTLRNDRKWTQRMIMKLAMSDDKDREQLDVLKELGAADK